MNLNGTLREFRNLLPGVRRTTNKPSTVWAEPGSRLLLYFHCASGLCSGPTCQFVRVISMQRLPMSPKSSLSGSPVHSISHLSFLFPDFLSVSACLLVTIPTIVLSSCCYKVSDPFPFTTFRESSHGHQHFIIAGSLILQLVMLVWEIAKKTTCWVKDVKRLFIV